MYVVYCKCVSQLHSAWFQPYIMKIYSLCIRARECEEVEKKRTKNKSIAYSIFYGFLCTFDIPAISTWKLHPTTSNYFQHVYHSSSFVHSSHTSQSSSYHHMRPLSLTSTPADRCWNVLLYLGQVSSITFPSPYFTFMYWTIFSSLLNDGLST